MFIRVIRQREDTEILINVNSIWKIEITYSVKDDKGQSFHMGARRGSQDPNATRVYKVFFGSETVTLVANPGDAVLKVLDQMYRDAVRAEEPKEGKGE